MLKIMIVDDEVMAIKTLQVMLEKYVTVEKVIVSETNFSKAIETIATFKPDILLLDIMMPPYTGFELLTNLQTRAFKLIFTTAYDSYAIQAIKFSALDYLLKPIAAADLKEAIDKCLSEKYSQEQYQHLLDNLKQKDAKQFSLAIPTLETTYFIKINELVRCESESNYTWFYLSTGNKILASKTLKHFEPLLLDQGFIRVHRSHLVSESYILQLNKNDILVLKDGTPIPLSRGRKDEILEKLKLKSFN